MTDFTAHFTQSVTIGKKQPTFGSFLQPYICELMYAPGKTRPEIFYLPKGTVLGVSQVVNQTFITPIEMLTEDPNKL
jgi:hypothetical protein